MWSVPCAIDPPLLYPDPCRLILGHALLALVLHKHFTMSRGSLNHVPACLWFRRFCHQLCQSPPGSFPRKQQNRVESTKCVRAFCKILRALINRRDVGGATCKIPAQLPSCVWARSTCHPHPHNFKSWAKFRPNRVKSTSLRQRFCDSNVRGLNQIK
jgi:hypothetical protein